MQYVTHEFDTRGDRLRNELPLEKSPGSVMEVAHQIIPADDSSLQWSPPGSGLTDDPSKTLRTLYQRLVTRYDDQHAIQGRTDDDVWRTIYRSSLASRNVLAHFVPKRFSVEDDEVEFAHAWKNGVWHCLEPISFDLSTPEGIRHKAHQWLGQLVSLKAVLRDLKVYLLLGPPTRNSLAKDYENAVSVLKKHTINTEIVQEADADRFARMIADSVEESTHSHTE